MADEIDRQNEIRVVNVGGTWIATIGPDDGHRISMSAPTPAEAIVRLGRMLAFTGYAFDPSWCPAPPR